MTTYNITLQHPDGTENIIQCDDDQYILEAAEAADLDMLYSCRAGACSCLLYTSPSPRDRQKSRMPSSA